MEILTDLLGQLQNVALWIFPFLFVLTVIIFFHELGHFAVARWCGVKVDAFAIGFGKEIFGFNDKQGTRWKFCWIPLGGYVKFMDDANATSAVADSDALNELSEEEKSGAFHLKPLWQRAAVVAAGPIANFLLAIVLYAALFMTFGKQIIPSVVGEVIAGGAAAESGLKQGDLIVEVDGTVIESFTDLQKVVRVSPGRELQMKINREGETRTVGVTPKLRESRDGLGNKVKLGLIGIKVPIGANRTVKSYGVLGGLQQGVKETYFITTATLKALKDLVLGRGDPSQLGGPIKIAQASKQAATASFATLINLAAVISIGIGLLNLFPIPMLDGGHLVFYGAEAIRGRPLSERTQEMAFRVGLSLVLMLMVFVTWNDIKSVVLGQL